MMINDHTAAMRYCLTAFYLSYTNSRSVLFKYRQTRARMRTILSCFFFPRMQNLQWRASFWVRREFPICRNYGNRLSTISWCDFKRNPSFYSFFFCMWKNKSENREGPYATASASFVHVLCIEWMFIHPILLCNAQCSRSNSAWLDTFYDAIQADQLIYAYRNN